EGTPDFGGTGAGDGLLSFRPRYYVPVKVAIFDEAETRRRRNALLAAGRSDALGEDPTYRWVYRPEMQFSLFDLAEPAVQRWEEREAGEGEFVTLEPEDGVGAEEFVRILYDLVAGPHAALPQLGDGRGQQLVFAVGEQEVIAIVGEGQTVEFADLSHLALLSAPELMTVRLYQLGDAANILWEWVPGLPPGWTVSYKAPHEARFVEPDADLSSAEVPVFRTLGGMRLKLEYEPQPGEEILRTEWALPGRFVESFRSDAATVVPAEAATEVYWEPGNWQIDPEDFDGTLTLDVMTAAGRTQRTEPIRLVRRELGPDEDEPMQGADVAMLEEM
ncbi:hypothetical protein CAI21_22600, partial [Alkalilimnicola ehrlichii]